MRRFKVLEASSKKTGALVIIAISIALYTVITFEYNLHYSDASIIGKMIVKVTYTFDNAVLIPLGVLAIFVLFGRINLKNSRVINKISTTTFGVYLLHDSVYCRSLIWRKLLKVDTVWYRSNWFPVIAVILILVVFFACSIIDMLRIKYAEPKMLCAYGCLKNKFLTKYVSE